MTLSSVFNSESPPLSRFSRHVSGLFRPGLFSGASEGVGTSATSSLTRIEPVSPRAAGARSRAPSRSLATRARRLRPNPLRLPFGCQPGRESIFAPHSAERDCSRPMWPPTSRRGTPTSRRGTPTSRSEPSEARHPRLASMGIRVEMDISRGAMRRCAPLQSRFSAPAEGGVLAGGNPRATTRPVTNPAERPNPWMRSKTRVAPLARACRRRALPHRSRRTEIDPQARPT